MNTCTVCRHASRHATDFCPSLRRGRRARDFEAETVAVIGKGKRERLLLTLTEETKTALRRWLEVRGAEPGPLFLNLDRARKGDRLTGRSVARIVAALGRRVCLTVRPHGLRHAATTFALDRTGGDVRRVQRFSRHA